MKRKAKILRSNASEKRILCIDSDNQAEILAYIKQDKRHLKKFNTIAGIILENLRIMDLYDKENIDKKSKNVTAMKFFKGQENDRIYCKEIKDGDTTFIVIMSVLMERKKNNWIFR